MSNLQQAIEQLQAGSTDLLGCISSLPELSQAEQLQIVLADQKYRVRRGEPANAEHYTQLLPWLSSQSKLQQQIVLAEFTLRLGSLPTEKLLAQFEANYDRFGEPLRAQFRTAATQWNQTPLDTDRFDALCDPFEEACTKTPPPNIEEYLQLAPLASQAELLRELIQIETYHRQRLGLPVDWPDYRRLQTNQIFPPNLYWIAEKGMQLFSAPCSCESRSRRDRPERRAVFLRLQTNARKRVTTRVADPRWHAEAFSW